MLPPDFLIQLAHRYELSPEQEKAFVELFSRNDNNELKAADALHISHNAFRTRMTGVYSKFSIGGNGPGKYSRLLIFLTDEYQKYQKSHTSPTPGIPKVDVDIDALVQEVREKVRNSIQQTCGTMRVLDMEQPIGLDAIYTRVNILEKVTGNRRLEIAELLEGRDLENFDRFSLGRIEQKRVPGLEAVESHDKLLILGKPGAGKTTFLKWLAIQCNSGQFGNLVPIFVTLKEFAQTKEQPTLLEYISGQFRECGVEDSQMVETLLSEGRALVFLDGLDEVTDADHDRVLSDIGSASRRFDASRFVMTCRIAAREYTFEQFTEVEIADFDDRQIADFSTKWFQVKDPVKAEQFPLKLQEKESIRELATNPLLLILLCLVFEERGGFPANRSKLYKEGLDVLLKKWDAKRNIKRDQVYKQLWVQRKKDLLSQIALTTFEKSEYLFEQGFVEQQIADYIRNLLDANTNPEALQLDSEAVLKSIEAQHGLLVERARGIYSFSHLTFQEYFTARQIKEKRSNKALKSLSNHVTEKRWREVFLLVVGMLPSADDLLQLMKHQIDSLLAGDEKLQQFLTWVERKSHSVEASYKPAAVRAFYFALARALDLALARTHDLALAHDLALDLAHDLALDLDLDLYRFLDRDGDLALYRFLDGDRDLALDLTLARALARALALDGDRARALDLTLDRALDLARARAFGTELQCQLQQLRDQLPDKSNRNRENFKQWWQANGQAWVEQLKAVIIQYRNIGHDWQFSDAQKKLLGQYYDANRLLVACLNSDCYVSREVRQSIEDTLLLPGGG